MSANTFPAFCQARPRHTNSGAQNRYGNRSHAQIGVSCSLRQTFVGPDFTRRPVKYERFIRPMALRYKKAHVTHPEVRPHSGLHRVSALTILQLNVTVHLPILSVYLPRCLGSPGH